MTSRRPALLAMGLLGLLLVCIWALATRSRELPTPRPVAALEPRPAPPPPSIPAEREPARGLLPVGSAPLPSPAASVPAAPAVAPPMDERSLMDKLRELRASDPELSLRLAREGNQRFPGDADSAERSWFVVKALSDLGRHEEAKREARELLREHRGSSWAEDVYRHLFVNPSTHPAERGYGKQFELE